MQTLLDDLKTYALKKNRGRETNNNIESPWAQVGIFGPNKGQNVLKIEMKVENSLYF